MALHSQLTQRRRYADYYQRMRLLAQQPKVKISGLVSLTLFTIAFFGVFAILPTFKTIAELTKTIQEKQVVSEKLGKKIKALDRAQEVYDRTVDAMFMLNRVLPEKTEFERLSWQIQWLAAEKQVNIKNGRFGAFPIIDQQANNNGELATIPIELSVVGQYPNIRQFATELENIDRLIVIKQININKKSGAKQPGEITANIKAEAYYLPQKK